ncbi:helix-turn-helix domain-containing protein [Streptococcus sp. zg-86]|uniref:Helix-turn-helix domain-containing protein n=1 Tax=Streptococcus zhangguiae TaxID=2664091 RepID=A0A6I4RGH3_9STRE|nr:MULTISPECIES: XRE family transcriptional regulator [unclassified Streptococcus]MTB63479.1 helix-turn-helix domain-containing protein [Streptococcus sp. zg-86]MTB89872.1 helix-turn-helix domain-containing protein [Streptococcus sp. zg-36]MWV55543.1 helix-turn-helix domain-containing protein [Streptococcus sp. zg-70]QTH47733.1 helix-turn-helix domain-containing protein [Streptococcus sp. zg-86]
MSEEGFGDKVRRLREAKKLTREQFCEDETELTVRQLTRIEQGESKPTLTKIFFIAHRLGLSLFELMPDYVYLPDQYIKLKYDLLRTPTYNRVDLVEKRNVKLRKIYDEFYDDLPDSEQLAIDAFQSTVDVLESKSTTFGREIVRCHVPYLQCKQKYSVNDLLVLRLFIEHMYLEEIEIDSGEGDVFLSLVMTLPKQIGLMEPDDLFVLRNVMLAAIRVLGSKAMYLFLPDLFEGLDRIMRITQDFQKYPILSMVRWKYELMVHRDVKRAYAYCREAIVFAQLMGDRHLMNQLSAQWQTDRSDFLTFLSC